jgi:hypothetical protein
MTGCCGYASTWSQLDVSNGRTDWRQCIEIKFAQGWYAAQLKGKTATTDSP